MLKLWLRITAWGLLDRVVHSSRLTERWWCDGAVCDRYAYAVEDAADRLSSPGESGWHL